MQLDAKPAPTRRAFLARLGRCAFACGLAGLAGRLAMRGQVGGRTGETCSNRGICSGCTQYAGCGLPQALSAKARGAVFEERGSRDG